MEREIMNTGELAHCDWPEEFFLQGGKYPAVRPGGDPTLAYVEVFPTTPRSYLRREGRSVREAEEACWQAWQVIRSCPRHPEHGPFDRREFRNGAGYCVHCGGWFVPEVTGLPPLPPEPDEISTSPEALIRFMRSGRWD